MALEIPSPKFGSFLRALRFGWGYSEKHGCFIRMSDLEGHDSLVELCPVNEIPTQTKTNKNKKHRCWWDAPEILDMLPMLKGLKRVKKYICVKVDTYGRIIHEPLG